MSDLGDGFRVSFEMLSQADQPIARCMEKVGHDLRITGYATEPAADDLQRIVGVAVQRRLLPLNRAALVMAIPAQKGGGVVVRPPGDVIALQNMGAALGASFASSAIRTEPFLRLTFQAGAF